MTESVDDNLIIGLNPGEYGDEGANDNGEADGTYLGGLSIWHSPCELADFLGSNEPPEDGENIVNPQSKSVTRLGLRQA